MYDFSQAPQPGFDIARGLAAGFGAVSSGLQAANQSNMLAEWDRNAALREIQRASALDQAQTLEQLGRTSNAALRGINANRAALYNSPEGYMQAVNSMNPVGQGSSRRLSADGKTIETVNALGQVTDTMPNLRGQAAENALINRGGISLYERANQLPKQEQFEAELQSRMAIEQMKAQAQMQMLAAGLRGGHGGGVGGAGNPKFKIDVSDINTTVQQLNSVDPRLTHLPRNDKGGINTEMLSPEDAKLLRDVTQQNMGIVVTTLGRGATNSADLFGGSFLGGLNTWNNANAGGAQPRGVPPVYGPPNPTNVLGSGARYTPLDPLRVNPALTAPFRAPTIAPETQLFLDQMDY